MRANRGDSEWVVQRLSAMRIDSNWSRSRSCDELIDWLYAVAEHRARSNGIAAQDRAEVAQDAMPEIVAALRTAREPNAMSENPAALLERVAARAVSHAAYRMRMCGVGGVPANGRNWRTPPLRLVDEDLARPLLEELPVSIDRPSRAIEAAADTVAAWVAAHVDVCLTADGANAVAYVLDRLASGVSRGVLVRGGYTGLGADPAMRYLGFDAAAARALGRWLLGRADRGHEMASVLDSALLGEPVSARVLAGWQRTALDYEFATANPDRVGRDAA